MEQKQTFIEKGRALWSCGLIHHVFDREVKGSNFAAARSHLFNFFNAESHRFSLVERRWKAEEGEKEMESGNLI